MFKMPTGVAALLVAGLACLACNDQSGLNPGGATGGAGGGVKGGQAGSGVVGGTIGAGGIVVGGAAGVVGAGGSTGSGGDTRTGGTTASGGTTGTGGTKGAGGAGISTTGGCSSAPVTFQVMPALNAATHWCLGQPESCSGWGEIRNSSGTLELRSFCGVSCETCTIEQCPPLACMGPTELTDQGVTWTWEGSYVTSSTCGASATTCDLTNCATPGQYTFSVCGFPNPDPSSADGCYEALGTTNQTCVPVLFEYPAIAPIVVTMPVE